MNTIPIFDYEKLKNELAQMAPDRVVYFICSCAERMLPFLKLSSDTITIPIVSLIEHLWSKPTKDLLTPQSQVLVVMENRFGELLEAEDASNSFVLPFVTDTVEAVIHMLNYLETADVSHAAWCGHRIYSTLHELTQYTPQFGFEQDWLGHAFDLQPVDIELLKQRQDLDALKAQILKTDIKWEIRSKSRDIGNQFVFLVEDYVAKQHVRWQEVKSLYQPNSQIEGYIENYYPEGFLINLGNEVQGIAPRSECQFDLDNMFAFLYQRVSAVVASYDEEKKRLILGSVARLAQRDQEPGISFYFEYLEKRLPEIEFAKVLCIAASCAEHLGPVITLWSETVSEMVNCAIHDCWELSISPSKSLNIFRYIEALELSLKEVLIEIEIDFKPELPFVEDAIVSTIYMLMYADSRTVNYVALCTRRAYDFVDQLAYNLAINATGQHPSDEELLASELVQIELRQQQELLNVLLTTPMESLAIDHLRQEAQQTGSLFLQWIQEYCALDHSKE